MRQSNLFAVAVAAVLICLGPLRRCAAETDIWEPLRFLIGSWAGGGSGAPGDTASGAASFTLDLNKKILVRKNRAVFPPRQGESRQTVHEDLMIIYPPDGPGAFRAIYFDSEGHVINYRVTFPAGRSSAIFESDGGEKSPRFKLIYESVKPREVSTDFQIATAGGEFKSFIKGAMKRSDTAPPKS